VFGEMAVFKLGVVIGVDVVAMKTPPHAFTGFDLWTPAFAVWQRRAWLHHRRKVNLDESRLRRRAILLVLVLGAKPNFNGAVAMVIALHRKPTEALAVCCAFVIVSDPASMSMH